MFEFNATVLTRAAAADFRPHSPLHKNFLHFPLTCVPILFCLLV